MKILRLLLCSFVFQLTYDKFGSFVSAYGDESECLNTGISKNFTDHVILAMKRGYWDCAKNALNLKPDDVLNLEFRNHFDIHHRQILKELTSLKSHIDSYQPLKVVSPAFQWAQSPTEVFLNVKFSHKIDAPATLNVDATNVTITAGTGHHQIIKVISS